MIVAKYVVYVKIYTPKVRIPGYTLDFPKTSRWPSYKVRGWDTLAEALQGIGAEDNSYTLDELVILMEPDYE